MKYSQLNSKLLNNNKQNKNPKNYKNKKTISTLKK